MRLIKYGNCFLFVVGSNYLYLSRDEKWSNWTILQFANFTPSPSDRRATPQEVLEEISLEELLALAENLC